MNLIKEEWRFFLENNTKVYQCFYTIALIAVVYTYSFKRYMVDDIYVELTLFSLLLSLVTFIWHLYLHKWSKGSLFAVTAVGICLVLLPSEFYLIDFAPDFSLLSFFLLSVSVDPKQPNLVTIVFYAKILLAIGVLLFYINGKIPDATLYRPAKHLLRHSYGFMHPNSLSMFVMSLFYDFSLMRKKTVPLSEVLWLIMLGLLVYSITDSRTGLLIFTVILVTSLLKKQLLRYKVSGKLVFQSILAVFVLGTLLSYFYQPESSVFHSLNSMFSGRLRNAHAYIKAYGFRLLPRRVPDLHYANGARIFNENYYVDSLMRQGILVYLLFPVMIGLQTLKKRFTLYHFIFILSAFLTAMIEDYGVSLGICTILLFNYFGLPDEKSGSSENLEEYSRPEI
ncbi:hypothetical protein [Streptococcus devriesei]|uniref:hypothetical protein n=1 Tax=Streptococcus devriesei TaxID=231233 RepID=UPI000400157E|nr:hypothetical protein [Streptococcus devriesei]